MATRYAFVTLITSDSYLPGALTLAAALREIHSTPATEPEVDFQTVCLATPETIDVSSIKLLRGAFDTVIGVEIIEDGGKEGLELLGKSRYSFRRQWGLGRSGCAAWWTTRWISWSSNGTIPPLRLPPPDVCCNNPSERPRIRGPMGLRLQTQPN